MSGSIDRPIGATSLAVFSLALAIVATVAAQTSSAVSAEVTTRRCGWFDNPTPGNASLHDRDGEWTVGMQGARQASGDWPRFGKGQLVRHGSGSYGFGCACLTVREDAAEKDILAIVKSEAKPLATCRHDPALKAVEKSLR